MFAVENSKLIDRMGLEAQQYNLVCKKTIKFGGTISHSVFEILGFGYWAGSPATSNPAFQISNPKFLSPHLRPSALICV